MTRTVLSSTALASVLLLIQTTWLRNGLFWGVIPDFAFLLILWIAYNNKGIEGSLVAFFSGLACDLLSSSPLGFFAFLYLIPAYAVSFLRKVVDMDRFIIPVILGFAGTILKGLASILMAGIFSSDLVEPYSFTDIRFWMESILNGALAAPLFMLLAKLKPILVTRKPSE